MKLLFLFIFLLSIYGCSNKEPFNPDILDKSFVINNFILKEEQIKLLKSIINKTSFSGENYYNKHEELPAMTTFIFNKQEYLRLSYLFYIKDNKLSLKQNFFCFEDRDNVGFCRDELYKTDKYITFEKTVILNQKFLEENFNDYCLEYSKMKHIFIEKSLSLTKSKKYVSPEDIFVGYKLSKDNSIYEYFYNNNL